MYPFFSNQISKIRSAWIIKHYFRIVDHLEYQILEVAWFSEIFLKTLSGFHITFFPHLPLSHLLIQRCTVIAFPPKRLCMPNMSKMAFFFCAPVHFAFCTSLLLFVSVCVFPFPCFLIHSCPVLQSWQGMNPQFGSQYFSKDSEEKTQSLWLILKRQLRTCVNVACKSQQITIFCINPGF